MYNTELGRAQRVAQLHGSDEPQRPHQLDVADHAGDLSIYY